MKHSLWRFLLGLGSLLSSHAAELDLEPADVALDTLPPNFVAVTGGSGSAGEWRVIMDTLPPAMALISSKAVNTNRKKVIAQSSSDPSPNRAPMLVYEPESFEDFTLTTRLKVVQGQQAQAAGIVFRWQDAQNYYSVRIDIERGLFYFRKIVNGEEQEPLGNRAQLTRNEWNEIKIECRGSDIDLTLNGTEKLPTLNDTQFTAGKVGYWTEADTHAYFAETKINYRPKIASAQRFVDQAMEKYDRLIELSLYAAESAEQEPRMIASNLKEKIGEIADEAAKDAAKRGRVYFARRKTTALVTLPLKDRNGEPMGACRVELKTFRGQTRDNAIVRAMPAVHMIQSRLLDRRDLFE